MARQIIHTDSAPQGDRHLLAGGALRRHGLPRRPDRARSRRPWRWSPASARRSTACSRTCRRWREAAGGDLKDAVKLTVYLTDLGNFALVNEIMAAISQPPYPARAAVGVASLPRGALVEIDAILHLE